MLLNNNNNNKVNDVKAVYVSYKILIFIDFITLIFCSRETPYANKLINHV